MSLYRRYIFTILLILILPVLAVLLIQYSQLTREKSEIETETLASAEQITLLADLQIESNLNAIKVLGTSSALLSQDWEMAGKRIRDAALLNPQWKNVLVIDIQDKKPVFALHETPLPKLVPELLNIKSSAPIVDGVTQEGYGCPCIYIFQNFPSQPDPLRYVLAVAVDISALQKILMQRIPSETIAAIVDREGNFIARSRQPEDFIGKPATIYVRNAIKTAKQGVYPGVTYEGFKNYTAYFTSPGTGWSTHIAIASSRIDMPRLWSLIIAGFGAGLALAVAAGLIFRLAEEFEGTASARLSAIVASSEDVIISKDLNGIINSWNASAERVFGYSAEEAIGKHISLVIPQDRLAEENEIINSIREGKAITHYETVRRRKDGSLVELSITVSPVKDRKGRIIGASKVARDITERKIAELQLREERETLETLNALAPALASTLDLKALVQRVTDEATKLTGAAFGAFFYNVINEEGEAFLLYTLSGAPKEAFAHLGMPRATAVFDPTFKGEATILSNDITIDPRYGLNEPHKGMPSGHLPVKSYLAVPVISRSGEVIGGLFFGHPEPGVFAERDAQVVEGIAALAAVGIDNARLYEQVRQGQKKAEAANQAKTDFLATMSHEIRTPMNAIVGLSSILAMSSSLNLKEKEFVKTLQSSADSLLLLINDLLDISKIEARSVELEEVPFSMARLIEEVVSIVSVRAREKGLTFQTDTETVQNLIFMGDPARLRQIITNLCSNAIKFTEHGTVSVKVLNDEDEGLGVAKVTIVVSDTGIGIPEDKLDTIFEKFVQADTSISRRYGGTGLGLSITKRLVNVMRGTISVDSAVGKGSTFAVSLPLQMVSADMLKDKHIDISEVAPDPQSEGSKKVLLVEDHEPNVMVAGTFLETLSYPYEIARDGRQAVEKIKTGSFKAVLMDVQMPGLNGFEATSEIREFEKREGRKRVFIIGVTAHAMAGDRERCLSVGMDDYMSKPFELIELRAKLEKIKKY